MPIVNPYIIDNPIQKTSLLLPCDGNDGDTTFPDSSIYNHTITVHNSCQIDTAQSQYGGASGQFSRATSDYLSAAHNAVWSVGANPFTVEAWIRIDTVPTDTATTIPIVVHGNGFWSNGGHDANIIWRAEPSLLVWSFDASGAYQGAVGWATATWYHCAASRVGNTLRQWVNGVEVASDDVTGETWGSTSHTLYIGGNARFGPGDGVLTHQDGHIDDVRILSGVGIYGAGGPNIGIPPSAAHVA